MDTQQNEIVLIADCLIDNYLQEVHLIMYRRGKSYDDTREQFAQWSLEFHHTYFEQMKDWKTFEHSPENIYQAIGWKEFLIEWGCDKVLALEKK